MRHHRRAKDLGQQGLIERRLSLHSSQSSELIRTEDAFYSQTEPLSDLEAETATTALPWDQPHNFTQSSADETFDDKPFKINRKNLGAKSQETVKLTRIESSSSSTTQSESSLNSSVSSILDIRSSWGTHTL